MYCHEGPWQKVDRIWMIHTDGTHNELIHKRTMFMEIAGNEFWGLDGETIWYDWQPPNGRRLFLAGYNLQTHKRTAYTCSATDGPFTSTSHRTSTSSPATAATQDRSEKPSMASGLNFFTPACFPALAPSTIPPSGSPGILALRAPCQHDPSQLSPRAQRPLLADKKLVIFTSNMFGPSYVFGVEPAGLPDLLYQ
jgi:oligogalacturonide lyase